MSYQWPTAEGFFEEADAYQWTFPGGVFDATLSGGNTTITVNTAVMTYAGQAITVKQDRLVQITNAVMNYAGQAITVRTATIIAITNAVMTYAAQAIVVTQGGIASTGQRIGLYISRAMRM